jgi:hypothetical protein
MEWLLETLDVFQTDEQARAGAFRAYADAGLPLSLVAEMLGLELPDGWEYADLDPDEPEPQPIPPALAAQGPVDGAMIDDAEEPEGFGMPPTKALLDDLRAWRRKSKKAGRLADFESYVIPDATMAAIRAAGDEWLAALDAAIAGPAPVPAVKAQAEPDRAAEEALRRKLAALFAEQQTEVAQAITEDDEIEWEKIAAAVLAVVVLALAKQATQQTMQYAAGLNIPLDIAKVNVAAWEWARGYGFELVKGINATTQQLVGQVIAQYAVTPSMTIADVASALDTTFGATRAQTIAITETTRANAQANRIAQEMLRTAGVRSVLIWKTAQDERVCDICEPLDGKPEGDWDGMDGPPAHVRCRCETEIQVQR